jgi:hypothetical protein
LKQGELGEVTKGALLTRCRKGPNESLRVVEQNITPLARFSSPAASELGAAQPAKQ